MLEIRMFSNSLIKMMNKTILFLKSYANSFWKIQCFVLYVNLWLPASAKKKSLHRGTQHVSLTSKSACKTLLYWISWKWIGNIRIAFLLTVTGAWMWESKVCFGQNGFEILLNPFLWKLEASFYAQSFACSSLVDQ